MRDEGRIEYVRNRFGVVNGRRISWSAILAGVAVACGITVLLGLLGAGLGAGSLKPLQQSNPFEGMGAFALIWMVITGIIAFFAAGRVSSYGSSASLRSEALTHGLVTWSVATLLGLWIVTGAAGTVLSGSLGLIGPTLSSGVQDSPSVSARVRDELEKRGITAEPPQQQAPSAEAQGRAEQVVREAGQAIARGVSRTALSGFGMLFINLLACLVGAASGAYRRVVEQTTVTERVA